MRNAKVEILVSTYNGEHYIAHQLISLLNQSYDNFSIRVRDDGSSDKTKEIISKYSKENESIKVQEGVNLGVVGSFFDLLYSVPNDVKFVAFCDQDDIWHKDKIKIAVTKLESAGKFKPALYCCRTRLVNNELELIGYGGIPKKKLALENALLQNVATGCTIVLNRQAIDLLSSKRPDLRSVLMHDYWFYLVISALGVVYFDEVAHIDYRQHGGNVVGTKQGLKLFLLRIKRFVSNERRSLSNQASEFLKVYSDELSSEQKEILQNFIVAACAKSFSKRLYLVTKLPIYRQSNLDTFLSKAMLVLGKYK